MDVIIEESELLENEIKRLNYEFQATREKIFKYYTIKRQTELINKRLLNSDTESLLLTTIQRNPKPQLCFYNQFIRLHCKPDESVMTILFPFNGECRFGFNLTNNREWNLEKYQLPPSIDTEHFSKEIKNAMLMTVSTQLEEMQKNIYAYYIREDQVKKLKEILDSRILLYHCLRYAELELKFKVFDTQTNTRRSVTVQLNFNLHSVKPNEVICEVKNTKDKDMETFLNDRFVIFTEKDIISAYELAFKNNDRYKFFV